MENLHETPIKCHDIFKALPDQRRPIRVVLTNGVAGVGKTFSVQKFTLDWAEGLENQDVSLVILLSFRELNLIKDEQYSLLTLLHVFHQTFQKVPAEKLAVCKLLVIFDGLDESRLSLDFKNKKVVSDVTQKSSVNLLLTNLINGNLLPSALVWITSRPAAANHCLDRVTEVRGFTDAQKVEYFRWRFSDEELSSRIISHIKEPPHHVSNPSLLLDHCYSSALGCTNYVLTDVQMISVCMEEEEDRADSAASSCLSMKSDQSKNIPLAFSNEHAPSDTNKTPENLHFKERKRSHVYVEEEPSCCALCQDVLKDPVSTSCGHWFCRQCITSYWDQSASSGVSFCPQCEERSRTRAGLQKGSHSSSVQSKIGYLKNVTCYISLH
ncbi:NACHT, LRR and PYD domains-containing protein 12-like [Micropterus salmoides]|uniref:NACHT, LRR and PYD domains-containing protein 12-like n=1 Tax=Micropterus salmoides TaxID=27706 RepID=UPI0018EE0C24|nr:NACHT, LRR and PYD domains-containing protein 12-like [Micropterus salmoides]